MSKITLRGYQDFAADSPFKYFQAGGTGHPLVAMPTGTGKSLVLAAITKRIMQTWPGQRVLDLTHVKELIEQDREALHNLWPEAESGVYSASLNRREVMPITFGGIATVARKPHLFKHTNIVKIDEAHLVSPKSNTMYRSFLNYIWKHNPRMKVIGTTATIYRMGQGLLTDNEDKRLFTDVCCDMTGMESFNWFIDEGYLANLIPKPMETEFDLTKVRTLAGEFNQRDLGAAVDIDQVTEDAIQEVIKYGQKRRSWLLFATSIEHAIHIGQCLNMHGIPTGVVHSKMKSIERDKVLRDFKYGLIRAVVNQNILTTGFDHPGIDLIAVLRPTKSTSLWVQMLGRGTRPWLAGGKLNCLVLDFARNTERLGPINDPILPKAKIKGKGGVAPIKICPDCNTYNHASARFCIDCGYEFPRGVNIYIDAGVSQLIARPEAPVEPIVETFEVTNVTYQSHFKNGFHSLKVSYFCGMSKLDEYIHLERPNMKGRARKWWATRSNQPAPETVEDALKQIEELTTPSHIRVHTNKKYPEILHHEFNTKATNESRNSKDDPGSRRDSALLH